MNAPLSARPLMPNSTRAARWPRADRSAQRLLVIDTKEGSLYDRTLRDLPGLLGQGDLLVFNDAATLPAALGAKSETGEAFELRLARESGGRFWALVFGAGDWRRPTEARGAPPVLRVGQSLTLTEPPSRRSRVTPAILVARVVDAMPEFAAAAAKGRLIAIEFEQSGAALWDAIYRLGRPVQYSYVERELPLWHVQNVFAARPWAFEMPSAARGFSWETLLALRRRGIETTFITHAAGLSSTGSAELDGLLPFPERYEVSERAVARIETARARSKRVIAVGTTVVRALESATRGGRLVAQRGEATLLVGPAARFSRPSLERPVVVDSVLSGIHRAGESHHALLEGFAPGALLERAERHAQDHGYLVHEFGDACLLLAGARGE